MHIIFLQLFSMSSGISSSWKNFSLPTIYSCTSNQTTQLWLEPRLNSEVLCCQLDFMMNWFFQHCAIETGRFKLHFYIPSNCSISSAGNEILLRCKFFGMQTKKENINCIKSLKVCKMKKIFCLLLLESQFNCAAPQHQLNWSLQQTRKKREAHMLLDNSFGLWTGKNFFSCKCGWVIWSVMVSLCEACLSIKCSKQSFNYFQPSFFFVLKAKRKPIVGFCCVNLLFLNPSRENENDKRKAVLLRSACGDLMQRIFENGWEVVMKKKSRT